MFMDPMSDQVLPTNVDRTQPCTFLDDIPLEIREIIYHYLLVAQHAKVEHRMKSCQCDQNRTQILKGADHSYCFHPAILSTNRQIFHEASAHQIRENLFVCFSSWQRCLRGWDLENHGLPLIANGGRALKFSNIATTIEFGAVNENDHWQQHRMITAGREPQKHIFTVNDLPAFCTSVLSMENGHEEHIRNTPLRIIINSDIQDTLREGKDGVPNPQTKLAWLLNPLRQLHSFQTVHIYDPGSESYKMGITASICSIRPTAKDTMGRLEIACAEGDDAHRNGNLLLALSKFKAGLDIISSGFLDFTVESEVLDGGLFAGLVTSRYAHGNVREAELKIKEAIRLDLLNKDHSCLSQKYEQKLREMAETQRKRKAIQDRKLCAKVKDAMEIVSNRHNKGDEAFGNGAFRLARSTYEAALTGMETIEDMRWKSYTLWSRDWDTPVSYEIREKTTFTLKAKIAMTCLEAESLSGRP